MKTARSAHSPSATASCATTTTIATARMITVEGANESVEPREPGAPEARREHLSHPARLLGMWREFARWAAGPLPGGT
jgi:hypothetical protein